MPDGTTQIDLLDRDAIEFEVTDHELIGFTDPNGQYQCYGALILEATVFDTEGVEVTVNRDQLLELFDENIVCDAEQRIAEEAE